MDKIYDIKKVEYVRILISKADIDNLKDSQQLADEIYDTFTKSFIDTEVIFNGFRKLSLTRVKDELMTIVKVTNPITNKFISKNELYTVGDTLKKVILENIQHILVDVEYEPQLELNKFTMDEGIPVKIGDVIKVVSMEEFEELDVHFSDEKLQKRIADSYVKVVDIQGDKDLKEYVCKDGTGKTINTTLFDSDIEYVLRSNIVLFRIEDDNKTHIAEFYNQNKKVCIDEIATYDIKNALGLENAIKKHTGGKRATRVIC